MAHAASRESSSSSRTDGYVYIIEDELGRIKIGATIRPHQRIRAIETSTGLEVVQLSMCGPISDYLGLERRLHQHFKHQRIMGEWFTTPFEEACAVRACLIKEFNHVRTDQCTRTGGDL